MTRGLRVAVSSRHGQPRCWLSATTFGPVPTSRLTASSSLKPSGADFMWTRTAAASIDAVSARMGEKWMVFSSCFAGRGK